MGTHHEIAPAARQRLLEYAVQIAAILRPGIRAPMENEPARILRDTIPKFELR